MYWCTGWNLKVWNWLLHKLSFCQHRHLGEWVGFVDSWTICIDAMSMVTLLRETLTVEQHHAMWISVWWSFAPVLRFATMSLQE